MLLVLTGYHTPLWGYFTLVLTRFPFKSSSTLVVFVLLTSTDKDSSGSISFDEFIQGVRDPLNEKRKGHRAGLCSSGFGGQWLRVC